MVPGSTSMADYVSGMWGAIGVLTALRARDGRLVFAGAHTALLWPGFIDGAVESGLRAAVDVRELLSSES